MPLEIVKERILPRPIFASPGDKLILSHTDPHSTTVKVLEHDFTEPMTFDRAVIFKLNDEFGMEVGIGGAFGKGKA